MARLPSRRPAPSSGGDAHVDLAAALACSDPDHDVQCPSCGAITAWPPLTGDEPATHGYRCRTCDRWWQVPPGAPWPDVVVDAGAARPAAAPPT